MVWNYGSSGPNFIWEMIFYPFFPLLHSKFFLNSFLFSAPNLFIVLIFLNLFASIIESIKTCLTKLCSILFLMN